LTPAEGRFFASVQQRHHRALHQAAPLRPPPAYITTGPAISTPDRLGGLIHKYAQAA
jgi:hypothetical protein